MTDRRGFTLIELLVVVAVIATLVALGSGYYGDYVDQARQTVVHNNLKAVREALANHFKERLSYPTTLQALEGPFLQESTTDLLVKPWGGTANVSIRLVVPKTAVGADPNAFLATETEEIDFPGDGRQIRDVRLRVGGADLGW